MEMEIIIISASTPIGLESGASKALDGSHSVCRFESDLAHQTNSAHGAKERQRNNDWQSSDHQSL